MKGYKVYGIGNALLDYEYKVNDNSSFKFATRRNKELNMTEFYNLIYQYEWFSTN